ncbi:MAG: GTP cyclohydrolase I FolE [Dehalococcoidales bacterium]|nr:GTP cyclohydrolase I FolE [Dehalococcoidales bacterium]
MDQQQIKDSVRQILLSIGEDPDREGLKETPRRVAEMYKEIFSGLEADPIKELAVGFELGHHEMILLKDIPFYSMCEHHMLPFYGVAHVAYIPNEEGRVVGISKIARVVDIIARKPQIQERMVSEIADAINEGLKPLGVAVVVQAEHMCMIMRGIKKPGTSVITSALRGAFKNNPTTRAEFMSLIQSK